MDGVLSEIGVFQEKNTQYHDDFFRKILNNRQTANPFVDILTKNHIVFIKGINGIVGGIRDVSLDNVLFSPTNKLTIEQLGFLKDNIDNFSLKQQFVINSFLQGQGMEPLNTVFLEEKCMNCIVYGEYMDYFRGKSKKPTQCLSCNKENAHESC